MQRFCLVLAGFLLALPVYAASPEIAAISAQLTRTSDAVLATGKHLLEVSKLAKNTAALCTGHHDSIQNLRSRLDAAEFKLTQQENRISSLETDIRALQLKH